MKRAIAVVAAIIVLLALLAGVYVAFSPDQRGLRHALSGPPAARKAAFKNAVLLERLRVGAKLGRKKAQYRLGRLLASGDLGFTDLDRAAMWMKKAADKNYAPAQLYMARFAFLGQGTRKDLAAGATWVRKAAENGAPNAAGLMGTLYLGGIGVDQDFAKAVDWLKKSDAPEGPQLAKSIEKGLAEIDAMPAHEKAEARRRMETGYKLNISHSFVKTIEALRRAQDKGATVGAAADADATDETPQKTAPAPSAAPAPAPTPATEKPAAAQEAAPQQQATPAQQDTTQKQDTHDENDTQNDKQGEQNDGH